MNNKNLIIWILIMWLFILSFVAGGRVSQAEYDMLEDNYLEQSERLMEVMHDAAYWKTVSEGKDESVNAILDAYDALTVELYEANAKIKELEELINEETD